MKTIELNLYSFNELSESAKEKAISKWYEKEDYPFLSEDIRNYIAEKLDTEKVISEIELNYSLSYSQGDGLSFKCDFDFEKWLEKYDFQEFKKRAILEQFSVKINANNGRYCYAHKDCVNMEYCTYKSYFSTDLSNLESLADSVLSDITDYYLSICKEAQKYGYSVIEYRMNNTEFSDLCEVNDYLFYENGNMY